jgi:hypothetical protein
MTQYKVGYGKPPKASQFNEESQAIREVGPLRSVSVPNKITR